VFQVLDGHCTGSPKIKLLFTIGSPTIKGVYNTGRALIDVPLFTQKTRVYTTQEGHLIDVPLFTQKALFYKYTETHSFIINTYHEWIV